MISLKKRIAMLAICLLSLTCITTVALFCFKPYAVYADEEVVGQEELGNSNNNVVEPLGLVTKITLTIGADNGKVWAKAHNDFTLGLSTIPVYVELYSSETYQEDYTLMVLESRNYISDLNIFNSLETSAPINGVQRYWMARMRYRFDNNDWVIKTTQTYLFDADGYLIA